MGSPTRDQEAPATHASAARMTQVRIVLIDDHAIVREGVRALLEEDAGFVVVGEFSDGDRALAGVAELAPDVVMTDLKMPGLAAVDTIRGLRQLLPQAQVMVFTSFAEDTQIRAVLDAGAIGYVLKDALREDLIRALRCVASGQPWLDPSAQRELMRLVREAREPRDELTPRELAVLRCIAEGLSNKEIARKLDLTEGTVKGYVSQILAKLKMTDRTQAALHAVRRGLISGD
jgi:DNA-binding NarL/FixJ family response regulator